MDIASGTQYVKENDMKWDLALKSGAASGSSTDSLPRECFKLFF